MCRNNQVKRPTNGKCPLKPKPLIELIITQENCAMYIESEIEFYKSEIVKHDPESRQLVLNQLNYLIARITQIKNTLTEAR